MPPLRLPAGKPRLCPLPPLLFTPVFPGRLPGQLPQLRHSGPAAALLRER